MKGELRTENPIEIIKDGGVAQNGEAVYLYEADCLPQVEQEYIFLAYAQEDGSLLVSGMGSNVPIEVNGKAAKRTVENRDSEDTYETYKAAIKNEIVPEGCRRDTSVYDVKESDQR